MRTIRTIIFALSAVICLFTYAISVYSQTPKTVYGTRPLTLEGDIAARMVLGINTYYEDLTEEYATRRAFYWQRDFASQDAYRESVEPNREYLRTIIGLVDEREPAEMELVAKAGAPALAGKGEQYSVFRVRWNVLDGLSAEGLLLQPREKPRGNIIALGHCEWTPEMLAGLLPGLPEKAQFARKLAENGFRVIIPVLINRESTFSGHPDVKMTNIPHREFIYRAAYELGRHIIGYEIQKVLAAVDWLKRENGDGGLPIGVIGYGEGGLLALYSAAVDERIDAAMVCGYFQPREELWKEPLDRNVWGLLERFGDAEIASLIAPRPLVVEACQSPELVIPPQMPERHEAAPGRLTTPDPADVEKEVQRAKELVKGLRPPQEITFINSGSEPPGSETALTRFARALNWEAALNAPSGLPENLQPGYPAEERLERQFRELLEHTQHLMREAQFTRVDFWSKADDSDPEKFAESAEWYRNYFWDNIIGKLPEMSIPADPRTRVIYDTPAFAGYEVVLDVYSEVIAYGILLVPKDLKPGERRPVVVCQHGLEGRPQKVTDPKGEDEAYNRFGARLAERGFIVYAPQNPYIGYDDFRLIIRKSHPLRKSLYAVIVRQHQRTLEWLASLSFVDKDRIGFYGISYGGKTAMRIPSILKGYCLSICSADFNEWIWKNCSAREKYSYMFTIEYDMYEFNLGNTFNYAEMSTLIFPRPFMVERGHFDGVAPDRWVAYEYARTRLHYDVMGLGDRTEIEFFNGPHSINGEGTFDFLHKHLNWPKK